LEIPDHPDDRGLADQENREKVAGKLRRIERKGPRRARLSPDAHHDERDHASERPEKELRAILRKQRDARAGEGPQFAKERGGRAHGVLGSALPSPPRLPSRKRRPTICSMGGSLMARSDTG